MARAFFWRPCIFLLIGVGLGHCDGAFDDLHGLFFGVTSEPETGCPPGDLPCDDGRCIHESWRCDGHKDCRDGSDEDKCKAKMCSTKQLQCDEIRCIPVEWGCDGVKDCADGSDELPSNCHRTCPATHFRCSTGQCIPDQWKCDGERDCRDGSDEDPKICTKTRSCYKDERMCQNKQECVSVTLWCDGKQDCRDGSDESRQECANATATEATACVNGQFRCGNGYCISAKWVCDGVKDCEENEDEKTPDCPTATTKTDPAGRSSQFEHISVIKGNTDRSGSSSATTGCSSGDFACADGECIPSNWRCDGGLDCGDGSDEHECDKKSFSKSSGSSHNASMPSSTCRADEFFCILWNGMGECLPLSKVCDGHHECSNGTEEGPGCVTACKNNGHCSEKCNPTPQGPVCSCLPGYVLSPDKKACIDIDECTAGDSLSGPCSQTCTNTRGSYKCGCVENFLLAEDRITCKAETDPLLLYGSDSQVNWITPDGRHQGVVTEGHHAYITVGLDYLEENHMTSIFFSDSEKREIRQVILETKQEMTILGGMTGPEGLAVDWSARNLYYVDAEKQEVGVCSLRNKTAYCNKLIYTRLSSPRGIAVHPGKRMMFITQWGRDAKIERAWLDGSGRMEIVTEKVIWPNAVTLDFIHERLYWIDARMNWIETAKYDGQDRRTVLHMKQSHPFGLTVLGNRLYWTDWATTSISTSLVNGSSRSLLHSIQRRPMGMVAMHASRHPWSSSPCDLTVENPCDHICLARPGNLHSCLCHAGYYLVDSKHCVLAASSGGPSIHAPPRLLEFTDTPLSCVSSKDCDCSHMPGHSSHSEEVCVCHQNRCERTLIAKDRSHLPVVTSHSDVQASMHVTEVNSYSDSKLATIIGAVLSGIVILILVIFLVRRFCPFWADSTDEKSLLDDEFEPRNKKSQRCPSVVGGFSNPSYENVTPSSYMVKFYKSRMSQDGPSACETPVSSQHV